MIKLRKQAATRSGLIFLLLLSSVSFVTAGVRPSPYFTSNMVMQQRSDVTIFGDAGPGEVISVSVSWCEKTYNAVAASDGRWETVVLTPSAGGPYVISFFGADTVILDNILIGEVWFAAGQSNMEMKLGNLKEESKGYGAESDSMIRFFITPRQMSGTPLVYPAASEGWQVCSSESSANLSAIAYYFSKKLQGVLKVPVGIIVSAWGGTPAEAWMSEEVLRSDSVFKPIFERWGQWRSQAGEDSIAYISSLRQWKSDSLAGRHTEKPEPPQSVYMMTRPHRMPSVLYNGMVSPFLRSRIKGIIWYQGTSNKEWYNEYEHLFRSLISSWRKAWQSDSLPFYYVQIAPYGYQFPEQGSGIREAQRRVMDTPNSGMVVTMDCGDRDNLHPADKRTPGVRLALWALARTYGTEVESFSGPVLSSCSGEGKGIRLLFDHADGGLTTSDGKPFRNFYIAGDSGEFYPADVVAENNSLFVYSPSVPDPQTVRYAFGNVFDANFVNGNGLPASPFKTETKEQP